MPRRPNVVFLIADDHRYSAIGATGDPTVQTPVLDRLIAEGTCFDRTYHFGGLTGAVCVPTRACLLAGAGPFRAVATRDLHDRGRLQTITPGLTTLPELLRRHGYYAYHVGKWHNDKQSFQRSFDGGAKIFMRGMGDHWHLPVQDFDPSGEYPRSAQYTGDDFSTVMFGEAAMRFVRGYDREQPFFLYCAFTAPHDPRTPPPEFAALYDPARVPLPPNFLPIHPFDNGDLHLRDEQLAPFPRTEAAIKQHIADYYGMISHLDMYVGRVLDTLEETGRAEDTIVVYTADHGLAVGQHGLMGKQNMYEHSARVPCVMRGRGIPAGRSVDALTYTPDLYPTLCDLAGVPPPESVEAKSLLPLLDGSATRVREYVGQVYKDVQRMVAEDRWKLIRYYRAGDGNSGEDRLQLFDLQEDPWELQDRSQGPACAGHVERLAAELDTWQRWAGDPLAGTSVVPPPAPAP